jgi:rod shape determining protein RodA
LMGAVFFLVTAGLAMIRSTTLNHPTLGVLPAAQATWATAGLVVMLILMLIDYHYWDSIHNGVYVFACIWLFAIFTVGLVSFGAKRWLEIGGLNVQPSELAKAGSIMWVAAFFARYGERLREMRWLFISLAYAGFPALLVFLQPNLSTAIMLMVIWFSMGWAAGMRMKHLGILGIVALLIAPIAWNFLEDYQRGRVTNFLAGLLNDLAGKDPSESATYGNQYNVYQALISIGSGGWLGQGYGQATQVQLRFLKVRHTDFIFSAACAEFGLVGALALIGALLVVVWRMLAIARQAPDPFGAYICYGVAAVMFFQMLANVGMNMNLMPVTGLPFPFLSYGGSSLVTFFVGLGLVQSVAIRRVAAR